LNTLKTKPSPINLKPLSLILYIRNNRTYSSPKFSRMIIMQQMSQLMYRQIIYN